MLRGFDNRNYYNATSDVGAIAQAIGGVANLGAQSVALTNTIASRRAILETAKSDLQKSIESTCGKSPIGCALDLFNLRNDCKNWNACRDEAVQYNRAKEQEILQMQKDLQDLEAMKLQLDTQIANNEKSFASEQSKNEKNKNLTIGISIGVGVLILGTLIIYLTKNK